MWFSEGRSSDCQGFFEWGYSGSTPGWYLPVAHLSRLKIRLISYRWFMISMLVSCYSSPTHGFFRGPQPSTWRPPGRLLQDLAAKFEAAANLIAKGTPTKGSASTDATRPAFYGICHPLRCHWDPLQQRQELKPPLDAGFHDIPSTTICHYYVLK